MYIHIITPIRRGGRIVVSGLQTSKHDTKILDTYKIVKCDNTFVKHYIILVIHLDLMVKSVRVYYVYNEDTGCALAHEVRK